MSADEEKTTVEVSEDTKAKEKAGGGKKKLLLFGGIGVVVLVLGVVLALFVVRPMMAGSGETSAGETASAESNNSNASGKTEKKKSHKKKKEKGAKGEASEALVYSIKDIVVNPAGTGGARFLSASFGFDLGSPDLQQEFESREPLVRDALITILSSKTVAQLTDPKQKEILRYQIKKRLSKLLDTDELQGVYYTDFVLQ